MSEAEHKAPPPSSGFLWPMLEHLKARGITMTAEEEEQWEDTPYNRIQLWFKYMTEGRGEVNLPVPVFNLPDTDH